MHAGELTWQRLQGVLGLGVIDVQAGLSLERNFEGDLLPLGHVQFGKRIKSDGDVVWSKNQKRRPTLGLCVACHGLRQDAGVGWPGPVAELLAQVPVFT